jgi:hypothetical protein
MTHKRLRLKYYIKKADNILIKGIEHIQSMFGIHSTVWQVVHFIHDKGCVHIDELKNVMHPFDDAVTVNKILTKLKITCVIFNAEDKITLTSNGIDLYRKCIGYRMMK